jgi:hypothetical protein
MNAEIKLLVEQQRVVAPHIYLQFSHLFYLFFVSFSRHAQPAFLLVAGLLMGDPYFRNLKRLELLWLYMLVIRDTLLKVQVHVSIDNQRSTFIYAQADV